MPCWKAAKEKMPNESANQKCLGENCVNNASGPRGLCRACYAAFSRRVNAKKTTWKKLERAGKCLPPHADANSRNPAVRAIAAAGLLTDTPSVPSAEAK